MNNFRVIFSINIKEMIIDKLCRYSISLKFDIKFGALQCKNQLQRDFLIYFRMKS